MNPSTPTCGGAPPFLRFGKELVVGRFEKRLNRFLALVELEGELVAAHVPNTGRMKELLVSGAQVALEPKRSEGRKSAYDLLLAKPEATWVCVDSRKANEVFEVFLHSLGATAASSFEGLPPSLQSVGRFRREVASGRHRFDFELDSGGELTLVEVKSVNLVEGGTALFPDAPTARGASHLESLTALRRDGGRSLVAFVVLRGDGRELRPNEATDPRFAAALREARDAGVEVLALGCSVTPLGIVANGLLPVVL